MMNRITNYVKLMMIIIIKMYQKFLSPMIGFNCRYTPTCSHYVIDVIEKFGIIKGTWIAFRRILRCQPFGSSGYDPIPD